MLFVFAVLMVILRTAWEVSQETKNLDGGQTAGYNYVYSIIVNE